MKLTRVHSGAKHKAQGPLQPGFPCGSSARAVQAASAAHAHHNHTQYHAPLHARAAAWTSDPRQQHQQEQHFTDVPAPGSEMGWRTAPVDQHYARSKLLGQGSFGCVYAGVQLETGKEVALKVRLGLCPPKHWSLAPSGPGQRPLLRQGLV